MHRLKIDNLGPIKKCDVEIKKNMVFTGPQSSGKSTIAKAAFYFRTIKEDVFNCMMQYSILNADDNKFKDYVIRFLRQKFLQFFGTTWTMDNMTMLYTYDTETYIGISLRDSDYEGQKNFVYIKFSSNIEDYLRGFKIDRFLSTEESVNKIKNELNAIFNDEYLTVYIPAGRSMMTLLSSQLVHFFAMMDDEQRRLLDYCTKSYIELIMKIKPLLAKGLEGLMYDRQYLNPLHSKSDTKCIQKAYELINCIMKGQYIYVDGEERVIIDAEKHSYIKINYASSGQQEAVWIANLIFYYLINNKKVNMIVEEPESHLYPESQRLITELIALFSNSGNSIMITTHSPYVLGAFNNMLYAGSLYELHGAGIKRLLQKHRSSKYSVIYPEDTAAYYVKNHVLRDCMDKETKLIDNTLIDGVSDVINDLFTDLIDLEVGESSDE